MRLECGDCLELMKSIPDKSVDLVVTDPPYGLSFMGKKWDYDVPSIEIWRECLRLLKTGGLFAASYFFVIYFISSSSLHFAPNFEKNLTMFLTSL